MSNDNFVRDARVSFENLTASTPAALKAGVREVPVKVAKAKLTELIRAAEAGERIVLTRHGKPVADLVPHGGVQEDKPMSFMARYEIWRKENPPLGIEWTSPDFDDQLPEDFLLQPLADDFDKKLAEHDRRVRDARRLRDEQGG